MCAYLFSIVAEMKKGLKNEKPWASYFAKQFSRVNRMGMAFNGECNKRDEVVVEYLNISTYLFIRMNHTTMYSFRASKNEIFTEKCLLKNIHVWIFFCDITPPLNISLYSLQAFSALFFYDIRDAATVCLSRD